MGNDNRITKQKNPPRRLESPHGGFSYMRRKAKRGKRDPPRGQLLFVAVGIRRNAGNSKVVRKIKDGGFNEIIQRFRVNLEALVIQKFNNVCFLLCGVCEKNSVNKILL